MKDADGGCVCYHRYEACRDRLLTFTFSSANILGLAEASHVGGLAKLEKVGGFRRLRHGLDPGYSPTIAFVLPHHSPAVSPC